MITLAEEESVMLCMNEEDEYLYEAVCGAQGAFPDEHEIAMQFSSTLDYPNNTVDPLPLHLHLPLSRNTLTFMDSPLPSTGPSTPEEQGGSGTVSPELLASSEESIHGHQYLSSEDAAFMHAAAVGVEYHAPQTSTSVPPSACAGLNFNTSTVYENTQQEPYAMEEEARMFPASFPQYEYIAHTQNLYPQYNHNAATLTGTPAMCRFNYLQDIMEGEIRTMPFSFPPTKQEEVDTLDNYPILLHPIKEEPRDEPTSMSFEELAQYTAASLSNSHLKSGSSEAVGDLDQELRNMIHNNRFAMLTKKFGLSDSQSISTTTTTTTTAAASRAASPSMTSSIASSAATSPTPMAAGDEEEEEGEEPSDAMHQMLTHKLERHALQLQYQQIQAQQKRLRQQQQLQKASKAQKAPKLHKGSAPHKKRRTQKEILAKIHEQLPDSWKRELPDPNPTKLKKRGGKNDKSFWRKQKVLQPLY